MFCDLAEIFVFFRKRALRWSILINLMFFYEFVFINFCTFMCCIWFKNQNLTLVKKNLSLLLFLTLSELLLLPKYVSLYAILSRFFYFFYVYLSFLVSAIFSWNSFFTKKNISFQFYIVFLLQCFYALQNSDDFQIQQSHI